MEWRLAVVLGVVILSVVNVRAKSVSTLNIPIGNEHDTIDMHTGIQRPYPEYLSNEKQQLTIEDTAQLSDAGNPGQESSDSEPDQPQQSDAERPGLESTDSEPAGKEEVRHKRQATIDVDAQRHPSGDTELGVQGTRTWGNGRNTAGVRGNVVDHRYGRDWSVGGSYSRTSQDGSNTAGVHGNLNSNPFRRDYDLGGSYSRTSNDGRDTTSLYGNVNRNPFGRDYSVGAEVSRTFNNGGRATFDAGVNQGTSGTGSGVRAGYSRTWNNGRTSLGADLGHSVQNGHRDTHGGVTFRHRFRRSTDNVRHKRHTEHTEIDAEACDRELGIQGTTTWGNGRNTAGLRGAVVDRRFGRDWSVGGSYSRISQDGSNTAGVHGNLNSNPYGRDYVLGGSYSRTSNDGRDTTSLYGNVNRNPFGRDYSVGAEVSRTFNNGGRANLDAGVNQGTSGTGAGARAGYSRTWNNGRTTLGADLGHSVQNGRRDTHGGVTFRHRLRRSTDNGETRTSD